MVHKISRIKLVISWFVIMHRSFRRSLLFCLLHPASPSDLPVLTKAKEAQGWSEDQSSSEQSLSLRDNGLCEKEIFVLQSLRRLEHSPNLSQYSFHSALRRRVSGLACWLLCSMRLSSMMHCCAMSHDPLGFLFCQHMEARGIGSNAWRQCCWHYLQEPSEDISMSSLRAKSSLTFSIFLHSSWILLSNTPSY